MYSPRLYKYQDSSVLYTPTVQLFGSLLHTHTLMVQTHTHDVSAPWFECYSFVRPNRASFSSNATALYSSAASFLCVRSLKSTVYSL